jgi:non-ribosomal peptide synthase protein (TIGR01720 family)
LEEALAALVGHHDALRFRYARSAEGWGQQSVPPEGGAPFTCCDLGGLPAAVRDDALEAVVAAVQASLRLESGPLLRMALFERGQGQTGRLLIVSHHLVVDGVSWRILLEDLHTAYADALAGRPPALPERTASYQRWAEEIAAYAASPALAAELDHWRALAGPAGVRLPLDGPGGANDAGSADEVEVALGPDETQALLQEVPEVYRTRVQDVLLAALALAAPAWTGARALRVDLEGHGREEVAAGIDLSRTVGWFTAIFPVLVDAGPAGDPGEALKAVKEALRRVPQQGIGYGVLRYLGSGPDAAHLAAQPPAEVIFNYWGQLDRVLPPSSPFAPALETAGPMVSPRGLRSHPLEISCGVREGRLRISFGYSRNLHRRATVESWARGYRSALREILDHCRSAEAGGATPSDFPLASFNQRQLDRLVGKLNRAR